MADLATLRGQLAALEDARGSGVLTASHAGKSVTYRSLADLRLAIAELRREIAAASGPPGPVQLIRVSSDKGL